MRLLDDERNTSIVSRLIQYSLIIIIGVILGGITLLLIFQLPTSSINNNVKNSIFVLEDEGYGKELIPGYVTTRLDNYTDAIMLNNAMYAGEENTIEKSLMVYHYSYDNNSVLPIESITQYQNGNQNYIHKEYARYWHGYLMFIKPMLIFFNYSDIRIINFMLQTLIVVFFLMQLALKGKGKFIPGFILTNFALMPLTIGMSLQYATIFYIAYGSGTYLLINERKLLRKITLYRFFLIVGMLTNYFDFLTYPMFTCGFLLVLTLIFEENKSINKQSIYRYFAYCFYWGMGYIGMWTGKWILATVFTRKNIIRDAILSVLYRSSLNVSDSGTTERISVGKVISLNVEALFSKGYTLLWIICIIICIFYLCKRRVKISDCFGNLFIYIFISLLPFLWYIVIPNHSYVHYWMTYRELGVTVLALSCGAISIINSN